MTSFPAQGRARQVGFSLFMAMIFLIVLSLLAVFAIRGVITGARMATNTQDWNLAFQSAEAALRDAEADELCERAYTTDGAGGGYKPGSSGTSVWVKLAGTDDAWKGKADTSNTSIVYGANTGADALDGPLRQPRYVIEDLGSVGSASLKDSGYAGKTPLSAKRITATGFGRIQDNSADGVPATRVVLQSVVKYWCY